MKKVPPCQEKTRKTNSRAMLSAIHVKALVALFICFCSVLGGYAQEKTLKGTVRDANGEAIIGASVRIPKTTTGTITDLDGKFTLNVPENSTIEISLLGYQVQKINVSGKTNLDITMQENTLGLNEVVVVGYGTQKKASITGAIDAVSSEDINVSFNSNMQNMLTGKLGGVRVIQTTSEPGSFDATSLKIRGMEGAVLYVIDGIPSTIDIFNRLSPSEIESVSVLKDGAAAVFGMKAGNGAILVTTKKGKNTDGKPTIEYGFNFGYSKLINLNKPMNAYDYATLRNEIQKYKLIPGSPIYTPEQMEIIKNTPGLNVYDAVLRKGNPIMNHTVSVSGNAGEKIPVTYYVSANYLKEYGIYRSGDLAYDRYNLRSNLSAGLGYGLTADVNLSYVSDKKDAPFDQNATNGSIFKDIWGIPPVDDQGNVLTSLYADEEKGWYGQTPAFSTNPLASTRKDVVGYMENQNKIINGILGLNWEIPFVKGLKARFQYSFEEYQNTATRWATEYSLYDMNTLVPTKKNSPSNLARYFDVTSRNSIQASLNYERTFWKEHNIKLLFLFEQIKRYNPGGLNVYRLFPMDAIDQMPAGSKEDQQIWPQYRTEDANQGFVGRLNYDFAGKYLLEASFRYDGSSWYAPGHQWGFFPYVSGGWRLSEEKFIKNTELLSFVDNMKLRVSYGKLGDDTGSYYNFASGYVYPNGGSVFDGKLINGIRTGGVTNNQLTWYTSEMYNLGFDFGLWGGLLGGSIEAYKRNMDGLLATRGATVPGTAGAVMPQENLNSNTTIGWELLLSHENKIGEFRYSVSGNLNMFRTKNRHVEEPRAKNSYDHWRNSQSNRWNDIVWIHENGGRLTNEEQARYLLNHEKTSQMALAGPGDYWHLDLNGDGWVDEWGDLSPSATNSVPKIVYGFTISGEYKGIDLSMVFNGAAKYTVAYEEFLRNPLVFGGKASALSMWTDRWHQNESGNWISGKYPRYREEWSYLPNVWDDNRRHRNASYLRLKNIELGYSLPQSILKKMYLQRLRVYVNAYNLLTFSGIKEMDPEAPSQYRYPMAQNFNLGLNVTF